MSDNSKHSGAPKGAPILKNRGSAHGVSDDYYATQLPSRSGAGSILAGEPNRTRQEAPAQSEGMINRIPVEEPIYKESPHVRNTAESPRQKAERTDMSGALHADAQRVIAPASARAYDGHFKAEEIPAGATADSRTGQTDGRPQAWLEEDMTRSVSANRATQFDERQRKEDYSAHRRSPHVRAGHIDENNTPDRAGSTEAFTDIGTHVYAQGQPRDDTYSGWRQAGNADTTRNGSPRIRTGERVGDNAEHIRPLEALDDTRVHVSEDVHPGYRIPHTATGFNKSLYVDSAAAENPHVRNAHEPYTHARAVPENRANAHTENQPRGRVRTEENSYAHTRAGAEEYVHVRTERPAGGHVRASNNVPVHASAAENGTANAGSASTVIRSENRIVNPGTANAEGAPPLKDFANPHVRFGGENMTGKNGTPHVRTTENGTARVRTGDLAEKAGANTGPDVRPGTWKNSSAPTGNDSGANPRVSTEEGSSAHVRINEPVRARAANGKPIHRQTNNGMPAIEERGDHVRQQYPGNNTSPRIRTVAGPAARLKKEGALAKDKPAGMTGSKTNAVFIDKAKVTTNSSAAQEPATEKRQPISVISAKTGHTRTDVPRRNRKMLSAIKLRNTGSRTAAAINGNVTGTTSTPGGIKEEAIRKITTYPGSAKGIFAAANTTPAAAKTTPASKGIEAITTSRASQAGNITGNVKGIINQAKPKQKSLLPDTNPKKPLDDLAETGKRGVRMRENAVRTRNGTGLAKTKKDTGPGGVNKKRRPLPVIGKLIRKVTGQADTFDTADASASIPTVKPVKRRKGLPLFAIALSVSVAVGGYNISETRSNLAVAGYQAYDETDPDSANLTTTAADMLDDRLGAYQSKIMYGNAAGTWSGSAAGGMPGSEIGDTSGSLSGAVDLTNHDNWYTYDHTLSEFLAALDEVAAEARNNKWTYGDSHGAWPGDDGQSSCDGLIDRALMKMGLLYRPAGRRLVVSDIPIYFPNLGFSVITDENDHMPGDVPVFVPIVGAANKSWHTFAVESVNPDGTINKYDFGMTERMQSMQPMQAEFDQWPERVFLCTLRGNWKDSSGSVEAGSGTHLPTHGGTNTAAAKNLVSVSCRNASMNGSGISGSFPNGVARYTMQHTYNADATYIHHDKVILDEEDERYDAAEVDEEGNHYVIVDRIEQTKTDITENIRVKDTSVSMIYTDKDGNTACATDAVHIKDGKLEYSEELYLKAIIGSATVRSGNQELNPEKYMSYVTDMIDASVLAAGGYDVELTTYETGQVRQWSLAEHEGTATANEVAIRARVTINIDCCLPEIIKKDSSHNWTKDEKAKALEYYEMDYPLFCMYHRIELARGSGGGLTGDAAEIYQYLSEAGLDDVHIAAILGNFMQESSLNPDTVQGSRWTAADFDKISYDGAEGGVNGPKGASRGYGLVQWTRGRANALQAFADLKGKSWRDMETQVKFFLEEFKSNTTGSPWLKGAASRMAFLTASDIDTATKVFFDDFEQPGDSTLPVRQRYAREFLAQIMAGGADVESYMKWAEKIAADNSHGYSQASRDGNPDYDCSSFVAAALKAAGFDVGEGYFTTATEPSLLRKAGFTEMAYKEDALERGDILWIRNGTRNHTEFYCGNGKTIGAHSSHGNAAPGDQDGNEISVIANNGNWEKIFRAPAAASADNADLSLEADVKFNTYGSIGGVKCVINGISNVGQGANAFAVDIIYGADSIGSHDHCYAYAEGIWGAASTPGPTGKNYQYYNEDKNYEHNGNWYNNWVKLKVCWWKDGTFRGYINNQQVFEDHASMTPQIVNIESTVISNGARIDAEFRNVKVKYALNGKYGTRGNWQTMGWFGLTSKLTASGRTVGGNTGYCTNGAPTYGVSALLGGTAVGADGMNWDTTMSYTGKPLSSYLQIGLNL